MDVKSSGLVAAILLLLLVSTLSVIQMPDALAQDSKIRVYADRLSYVVGEIVEITVEYTHPRTEIAVLHRHCVRVEVAPRLLYGERVLEVSTDDSFTQRVAWTSKNSGQHTIYASAWVDTSCKEAGRREAEDSFVVDIRAAPMGPRPTPPEIPQPTSPVTTATPKTDGLTLAIVFLGVSVILASVIIARGRGERQTRKRR